MSSLTLQPYVALNALRRSRVRAEIAVILTAMPLLPLQLMYIRTPLSITHYALVIVGFGDEYNGCYIVAAVESRATGFAGFHLVNFIISCFAFSLFVSSSLVEKFGKLCRSN